VFVDVNDASGILATIDSGFVNSYRGKDRAAWESVLKRKRKELAKHLAKLPSSGLSENDTKAVAAMRTQLKTFSEDSSAIRGSTRKCEEARSKGLDYSSLRAALVACFVEIGNNLSFEGTKVKRVTWLDLLHRTDEPERRKAVFLAFVPLWQAINGNDESDSPYRRLMALAAADAAKHGSEIDAAARDAGVESGQVEHWLEQILDAWREVSCDQMTEPWDFRYQAGAIVCWPLRFRTIRSADQSTVLPGPGRRPQTAAFSTTSIRAGKPGRTPTSSPMDECRLASGKPTTPALRVV
jgi:hypothetical protein